MLSYDKSTTFRCSQERLWDLIQMRLNKQAVGIIYLPQSLVIFPRQNHAEVFYLEAVPPHYTRLRYILTPNIELAKQLKEASDLKTSLNDLPKEITENFVMDAERWLKDLDKEVSKQLDPSSSSGEALWLGERNEKDSEKQKNSELVPNGYKPFDKRYIFVAGLVLNFFFPPSVLFLTAVNWRRLGKPELFWLSGALGLIGMVLIYFYTPKTMLPDTLAQSFLVRVFLPVFIIILAMLWQDKAIKELLNSGIAFKESTRANNLVFLGVFGLALLIAAGIMAVLNPIPS